MSAASDPSAIFREEAAELLVKLEEALLGLENAPNDKDLVDTAFRALHTIKGSGAMFGFEAVAGFTHHLENAFDRVRKGEIPADSQLVGLALGAIDHIQSLIESPETASAKTGEDILSQVAAVIGASAASKAQGPASDAAPPAIAERATWRVRFKLSETSLSMGMDPLRLLAELRDLGDCTVVAQTQNIPFLEDLNPSLCLLGWDVILTTDQSKAKIEDVFIFVMDDAQISIERAATEVPRLGDILIRRGDAPSEVVEAAVENIQHLGNVLIKEGVVSKDQVCAALAEQHHIKAEASKAQSQAQAQAQAQASQAQASSIRVPAERLDSLMDQVGELVIAQARLKQLVAGVADSQFQSLAEEIERLSNGLRDTTMSIRTVPIGTLFSRFRRLVRDISQELGKDVALVTSGEETELDKTVIERLNDPLVHIVRNSMDHGIETPAEREQVGKQRQGRLHLSAVHSGAQVYIHIRDDGRGLNADRIRAKAIENGLIPADSKLSDQEMYPLIFQPGFSTAKEVTSLSGRGVGMDVVKRTIESLRGSVEVSSTAGEGAQITLQLPLTLAIIDGLLVRVGSSRYVMPLSVVEECVELTAMDDQPNAGRHFLNLRGDLIPFIKLRDTFQTKQPVDKYPKVVVVRVGERRIGLVVDQVIGEHQTVIKSLSKLHASASKFSGATILGDGSVALIIDVAAVTAKDLSSELERQAS